MTTTTDIDELFAGLIDATRRAEAKRSLADLNSAIELTSYFRAALREQGQVLDEADTRARQTRQRLAT